jgi:hypothetical protein
MRVKAAVAADQDQTRAGLHTQYPRPAEELMIGNTNDAWGWPARSLHWVTALLIIAVFAVGLWMTEVPVRSERPYYFAIHASLGMTLLILVAARFAWAMLNAAPATPAGTPAWQVAAARFTHRGLYALTFATALFGWLLGGLRPAGRAASIWACASTRTRVCRKRGRGFSGRGARVDRLRADRRCRDARGSGALPSLRAGRLGVAPDDVWAHLGLKA